MHWHNCLGKNGILFSKKKKPIHTITIQPGNCSSGHLLQRNEILSSHKNLKRIFIAALFTMAPTMQPAFCGWEAELGHTPRSSAWQLSRWKHRYTSQVGWVSGELGWVKKTKSQSQQFTYCVTPFVWHSRMGVQKGNITGHCGDRIVLCPHCLHVHILQFVRHYWGN